MDQRNNRDGFESWGGFVRCDAPMWAPAGVEELQQLIAREGRRRRIRMVGGGYSVSPLVPTDGCLISTEHLTRPLRFEPHGPQPFIEVEAGMSVWDLNRAVAPFGLRPAMPSLFVHPTLAGLMATGGHGVGQQAGCFADGVDVIGWVDACGELHRIERGQPNFEAWTTSLGSLGAIYSLRVMLERDYRIRIRQRRIDRERFFAELDDLLACHESVELFMLPQDADVLLITFERTSAPCTPRSRWLQRALQDRVGSLAVNTLGAFAKRSPRMLYELTTRLARRHLAPRTWVDWASTGYHIQTFMPVVRNSCFAFDHGQAVAAFRRYAEVLASYTRRHRYPVTFALHARFTGASRSWLAPAHGRPTVQIDLVTHREAVDGRAFFEEMEDAWLELSSARAHWGKHHAQPNRMAERYPRFADFEAYRARVDPNGVFLNDYLVNGVGFDRPVPAVGSPGDTLGAAVSRVRGRRTRLQGRSATACPVPTSS